MSTVRVQVFTERASGENIPAKGVEGYMLYECSYNSLFLIAGNVRLF